MIFVEENCLKVISSLLESAESELASSDNTFLHHDVSWLAIFFVAMQFDYINSNVSWNEYPEFSSVVECAF